MTTGYVLTPRARGDLEKIWDYSLETWGEARAVEYLRELALAFADLASGLVRGRRANEVRQGYFRYSTGAHVVFYRRPQEEPLVVVRILHRSMDAGRHM